MPTSLIETNAVRPFHSRHFADNNTVELGYDVMKETKYLVVLYANVVITDNHKDLTL
jgi:hypothetical protein